MNLPGASGSQILITTKRVYGLFPSEHMRTVKLEKLGNHRDRTAGGTGGNGCKACVFPIASLSLDFVHLVFLGPTLGKHPTSLGPALAQISSVSFILTMVINPKHLKESVWVVNHCFENNPHVPGKN